MTRVTRPRLLDLFCGAGGAATGYARAGFDVVGVDIRPQPNYPFKFIQYDALYFLRDMILGGDFTLPAIHAIHASPPCQRYSTATKRNGTQQNHPDLIAATRWVLKDTGLPYVIENVVGAPLLTTYELCGTFFNLAADGFRLRRHRCFELSWDMRWHRYCSCSKDDPRPVMDVTGGGPTKKPRTDGGGGRPYKGTADQARRIMGIDWMTKAELNEAIPPAYTEFIGHQLLAHINITCPAPAEDGDSHRKETEPSVPSQ